MSLLSSLFTAPGQNAANSQTGRAGKVASTYADLFNQQANQYKQYQQTAGNIFNPNQLSTAFNAINQGPESRISAYGAGATEHAAQNANQYNHYLQANGYGDGASTGAAQGFFQGAAHDTNQYAQEQYDPQEALKRLFAALQAMQAGQSYYGNSLGQLGSGVYGQPQVQVGQGLGSILGGLAGTAASAYGAKKAGQ